MSLWTVGLSGSQSAVLLLSGSSRGSTVGRSVNGNNSRLVSLSGSGVDSLLVVKQKCCLVEFVVGRSDGLGGSQQQEYEVLLAAATCNNNIIYNS